jgi:hypothetical protein
MELKSIQTQTVHNLRKGIDLKFLSLHILPVYHLIKKHELLINVVLIRVKLKKLFNNPVPKLFSVRSKVPFVKEKEALFLFLKLLLKHSSIKIAL